MARSISRSKNVCCRTGLAFGTASSSSGKFFELALRGLIAPQAEGFEPRRSWSMAKDMLVADIGAVPAPLEGLPRVTSNSLLIMAQAPRILAFGKLFLFHRAAERYSCPAPARGPV
jgi:hypothetical protein